MFGNVWIQFKPFKPFKPFKHFGVSKNLLGHPAAGGPPKMFGNVWKCLKGLKGLNPHSNLSNLSNMSKHFQTFPNIFKHVNVFRNVWKLAREILGNPKMFEGFERFESDSNISNHFQTFPNISKHFQTRQRVWKCLEMFESDSNLSNLSNNSGSPKISRATPPPGAPPKCLEMFGNVWKCLEMFERFESAFKPFKPFKHLQTFSNIFKHVNVFGNVWKLAREILGNPHRFERFEWFESGFKPFQTFPNISKHFQTRQRVWKRLEMFGNVWIRFKPFKPFKHFGVSKNLPGHPAAGGPPKMFGNVWRCSKGLKGLNPHSNLSNLSKHFQTFSNTSTCLEMFENWPGRFWETPKCSKGLKGLKGLTPDSYLSNLSNILGFPIIARATPPSGAPQNVWKCLELFERFQFLPKFDQIKQGKPKKRSTFWGA